MNFLQLVKTNPHLPLSPNNSQTLPIEARHCLLRQGVPKRFFWENAAVRMSLKSTRWKGSLTSSSSKMDTTENCFASNRCRSSEKATAEGFAVGDREPSAVNVCASLVSCHCLPLFYSSDCDLCSCVEHLPLVKDMGIGSTAPATLGRGTVVCSGLGEEPSGTYMFSCPIRSAHQVMHRMRRDP